MNRGWIAGGLASVVILAAAFLLRGQAPGTAETKEKRTITTSGAATIRVRPDSARVFFGIESLSKELKTAREDNNKAVKTVLDSLAKLKIPDLRMKTSDITVSLEKSRRHDDRLEEIIGYRIRHTFTVLVEEKDAEKLGALARRVLETALENGANIVETITFFKKDDQDAKRAALVRAVEEATANAKALAAGAKMTIRDTISIAGQPDFSYGGNRFQQVQNAAAPAGTDDAPLVAGDLMITCTVSVTCSY